MTPEQIREALTLARDTRQWAQEAPTKAWIWDHHDQGARLSDTLVVLDNTYEGHHEDLAYITAACTVAPRLADAVETLVADLTAAHAEVARLAFDLNNRIHDSRDVFLAELNDLQRRVRILEAEHGTSSLA